LQSGEFMDAYTSNRDAANETALESSPVAKHIQQVAESGDWTGATAELLELIDGMASDAEKKLKTWPKNPRALSGALKRLAPNLRAVGVEVDSFKSTDKQRRRLLRVFRTEPYFASGPSEPSDDTEKTGFLSDANGPLSDANGPLSDANGPLSDANEAAPFAEIPGKTVFRTQADGSDAKIQTHSKRAQVKI
jgi:hypothetical protein